MRLRNSVLYGLIYFRMKPLLRILLGLLILGLVYLLFWPVNIDPVVWNPPEAPSLEEGKYKQNDKLAQVQRHLVSEFGEGPEDLAFDTLGNLYTGLVNGKIIKFPADGSPPSVYAESKGRALGMQFDAEGRLIVADSPYGLLAIDRDGEIEVLTDSYDGEAIRLADDLDIGSDGKIYFSDASRKFALEGYRADLVEHGPNGRLYSYDPKTKKTELLMDSLHFANGIALNGDESFLLVNETASYRIYKYWLKGPKAGTSEIFADNLPGFPDNLSYNDKGTFWVAFANPRNPDLDKIMPSPFIRKIVWRLPEFVQPQVVRYSMVMAFDEAGNLLHNLQDTNGALAPITSAHEIGDKLYMGSLSDDAWGVIDVPR